MIGFQGVRVEWLPEEAAMRRKMERHLMEMLSRRGFQEVGVPLLEARTGDGDHPGEGFRPAVSLRSDFTRAVARLAVSSLAHHPRPLKLAYSGPVFRPCGQEERQLSEVWQVGGEVVGASSKADREIMTLAAEGVKLLACQGQSQIILGDVALLRQLLSSLGLDAPSRLWVEKLLSRGDLTGVEGLLKAALTDEVRARAVMDLISFAGSEEETSRRWREAGGSLDSLNGLLEMGEEFGRQALYSLGLTRELDYYTGPVFVVYAGGSRLPVAQGGRYDDLLSSLGESQPATGFSWNLDQLYRVCRPVALTAYPGIH